MAHTEGFILEASPRLTPATVLRWALSEGQPCAAWHAFDDADRWTVAVGARAWARGTPREVARSIEGHVAGEGDDTAAPGQPWFGGFAFDGPPDPALWPGFGEASFFLPKRLLEFERDLWTGDPEARLFIEELRTSFWPRDEEEARRAAEQSWLERLAEEEAPESQDALPDVEPQVPDAWRSALHARIETALLPLRTGEADKLVIGASLAGPGADATTVWQRLIAREPDGTHFLYSPGGGLALLGATPERLVKLDPRRVETMALAGTARRSKSSTRDRALGEALLASTKDRAEHAVVVEAIREALSPAAAPRALTVPASPRLRRLATLQHLETPILAERQPGDRVLDLSAALHPTPALGGRPRETALRLVRSIEGGTRGWFGGGIGHSQQNGQGDIAVIIRSLLISPTRSLAWAGAGLMPSSDPAKETAEIEAKIRVALSALG